jgi:hypothetical protein
MGLIPRVFFLLFLFYSSAYDIDDETRQDDAPSSHSIPASLFPIHFFLEHTICCSRSVPLLVLLRFVNRCRTHESILHGVYGLVRRYEEFGGGLYMQTRNHNRSSSPQSEFKIIYAHLYSLGVCLPHLTMLPPPCMLYLEI